MRRKHRFLSYVLAAALFLGLSAPIPASAASLYFIGLNDNVPPMTAGDMPFWSGGTLYVPYTVFDANLNGSGVNLGQPQRRNRDPLRPASDAGVRPEHRRLPGRNYRRGLQLSGQHEKWQALCVGEHGVLYF